MPRVIIIGGGFGGLDAARALAKAPVQVTLLDRHNHHVFQPLLYQVATAALSPGDIASPIRWILRHQQNVEVLLAFELAERATDPEAQRRLLTFVIVGGGPTGVELAGALAEIARQTLREDFRHIRPESARIVLLEGGPHLLAAFPDSLREASRVSLQKLGVEVRTGCAVTSMDEDGVTAGGEKISAQTILWAAGVAASPLAASLGVPLDRAGRVTAEPTLNVPGHPEIFVAGDICSLSQDGKPLPGVAQVAKQQGAHAAKNVVHAIRGEALERFRYLNFGNVATIGRGAAVVDIGPIRASGWLAWIFWLFLHIFWLIGFRNRVAVLGEWAWSYITLQRRVRLITGTKGL